jgi:methionyl-tRNA formyltransferase
MSVGLYLMTEKGLAVLASALGSGVEIAHVTTAPAAGMNDDSHEHITRMGKERGIPTFLRAHPPEFNGTHSIAAGWRWMLDVPNLVVLHDSLLPRYRGFSPLITALVNGESSVGVTAFLAESEPDTGPIIAQQSVPVTYPARMRDVLDRLVPVYRDLAAEVCETLATEAALRYTVQDHGRATYSLWRDEDDYRIDWTQDDRRICRLVDAASDPFPGAWTSMLGRQVIVIEAVSEPDRRIEDRTPGKVAYVTADGHPVVVCGAGLVRLPTVVVHLKTRFV